jgi:electron transfer flavoprotein beta subunit
MSMEILVCVKRVPATGGKITLSPDGQEIDTRYASFTISPHEECGVEEALRLVERFGGSVTVLTLGAEVAADQLRDAIAMGAHRAVLLQTDGSEWDPQATARAIVDAVRAQQAAGHDFDLILFGNEAADTGEYQVAVRVAQALGRPVISGVKALEVNGTVATVKREAYGGWEIYEIDLPAVITVKEGLNLPRYPTVPGRLKAKRAPIEITRLGSPENALRKTRLRLPPSAGDKGQLLGRGPEAVPAVIEVLRAVGALGS